MPGNIIFDAKTTAPRRGIFIHFSRATARVLSSPNFFKYHCFCLEGGLFEHFLPPRGLAPTAGRRRGDQEVRDKQIPVDGRLRTDMQRSGRFQGSSPYIHTRTDHPPNSSASASPITPPPLLLLLVLLFVPFLFSSLLFFRGKKRELLADRSDAGWLAAAAHTNECGDRGP